MFCSTCGKNTPEGAKFCESCGTKIGMAPVGTLPAQPQYQPAPVYGGPAPGYNAPLPQKSLGIAAILSLLIPGIGQMYVSRFGRGVAFLVAIIVLWIVDGLIWAAAVVNTWNYYYYTTSYNSNTVLLAAGFIIVILIFHIFAAYDAYKLAKEYNSKAYQTGHAPW